jgi:hypothetical protein
MYWHARPGTRRFTTGLDSLDAARYRVRPSLDSFLVRSSTFESSGPFWTAIPGVVAAGVSYQPGAVFRGGLVANVRLWSQPFFPEPPLVVARMDLRPADRFALSLAPGWHRTRGMGGHAAVCIFYEGIGLTVDAEVWGLPSYSSGCVRLRLGYDF